MNGIYKSDFNDKFYKKIQTGCGRHRGMFLWQPMKKIGCFYIRDTTAEAFWLDDFEFELVKYPFSIKRCLFDLPAKIRLMHERGYYKTMSGDWRDSHMMKYILKDVFYRLSLNELREVL